MTHSSIFLTHSGHHKFYRLRSFEMSIKSSLPLVLAVFSLLFQTVFLQTPTAPPATSCVVNDIDPQPNIDADTTVRIEFGTDGFPAIAYVRYYTNGQPNELRFVHCTSVKLSPLLFFFQPFPGQLFHI